MSQRRSGIFNRCPACRLNNNLCVCSHIQPLKISTAVSLIVHVSELKLTSNTAWFVEKLLPQDAQIFIRGKVDQNFDSLPIVEKKGTPLFLYPHEDAVELSEEFVSKHPGPYHLIVPDGNWHQARRVRKREKNFSSMPAVKLPEGLTGEYRLRQAHQTDWLSTYEAVAHALGILESREITEKMLHFFRLWVQTTIYNRTKKKSDRPVAL
ncbi:MAG TPA: tRNA-uridine aminocarboxypropyltransferase [Bacteriovoracaceae bacterium]|nr:tRNA-uridine aminocarboxypropyltransferase [Bacteriovoracaceae bacterium]